MKEKIFENGDKYFGYLKDGKMTGHGTFTFANGDKYVGIYKDGKRNGRGTLFPKNGSTMEGIYKDRSFQYGVAIHDIGTTYAGELKNYQPHGKGTWHSKKGYFLVYEGEFKNGMRHGQGILTNTKTGAYYEGEFEDGSRTGFGKLYINNCLRYSGKWFRDEPDDELKKEDDMKGILLPYDGH